VNRKTVWQDVLIIGLAISILWGSIEGIFGGLSNTPYRYVWEAIFVCLLYASPFILISTIIAAVVPRIRTPAGGPRHIQFTKQRAKDQAEEGGSEKGTFGELGKDDPRLRRLAEIMQVTKRLKVAKLAEVLEMDEATLWKKVFGWAKQFGFTVDGDTVEFVGGDSRAFIEALERDFAAWAASTKKA